MGCMRCCRVRQRYRMITLWSGVCVCLRPRSNLGGPRIDRVLPACRGTYHERVQLGSTARLHGCTPAQPYSTVCWLQGRQVSGRELRMMGRGGGRGYAGCCVVLSGVVWGCLVSSGVRCQRRGSSCGNSRAGAGVALESFRGIEEVGVPLPWVGIASGGSSGRGLAVAFLVRSSESPAAQNAGPGPRTLLLCLQWCWLC
ncbi:hypothetical protein BGZ57DRAFT_130451 [Hyaloscypha finlandica]|nr:hypothetical protein BGZ57DRAFT_130451 [Hyaloscypha finlandica]